MSKTQYINLNGEFIEASTAMLFSDNRAFNYGDGLFETIYASGTHIHFLPDHIERLHNGMKMLNMNINNLLGKENMKHEITRLLNKNRLYKGVRIKATVFRESEGLYTPKTNDTGFIIQTKTTGHEKYILNEKGLIIDVYPEIQQPINKLSNIKTTNRIINVMAGIYKASKELDDVIIINQKGTISESLSSNLFITKDNKIYTPPLQDGCVEGIIRKKVIQLAPSLGLTCKEHSLKTGDLLLADEIFLTNSIKGITWVVAYKQKRYYNKISRKIIESLNKISLQKD